jgi:GNAT superfamily N-acetyltransferase
MDSKVPDSLDGSWYLSILGVHPDARGQGLAHTLLERTLQRRSLEQIYLPRDIQPLEPGILPTARLHEQAQPIRRLTARPYWLLWRDPRN